MRLEQRALAIRIPNLDTEIQTAFRQRIQPIEPIRIAGDMPITVQLHDPAKLTVGGSMEVVRRRSIGQRRPEADVPLLVHRALVLLFAEGSFQLREQVRYRLRVIPDVGTRSWTAACVSETAFPRPQIAAFLAQHGWRFQDRQV